MVTHGNLRVKLERNYPGLQLALIFWESRYPKIPQLRRTSISYHGFLYGNHSYKLPCSTGVKYTERFSGQSFKRVRMCVRTCVYVYEQVRTSVRVHVCSCVLIYVVRVGTVLLE